MKALEVKNIRKNFGKTEVLRDISFSLEKGQVLAIIGSSGSGKTTLLRCLNFLETPDSGAIVADGKTLFDSADAATASEDAIRQNRLHFGLVFQNHPCPQAFKAWRNRGDQRKSPAAFAAGGSFR